MNTKTISIKERTKQLIGSIPLSWIRRYLGWKFGYAEISFSPDGEDLILRNMLRGTKNGFYVDVGAYHPIKFSNTYSLYESGWNGLNIDAMPGSMDQFKQKRPRDTNIESAISDTNELVTYHMYEEQAYNSLSSTLPDAKKDLKKIGERKIATEKLSAILGRCVPPGQSIDLMTIDVEGYDMKVLKSNDWEKYRPMFIMIEEKGFDAENPNKSEIYTFLKKNEYRLVIATPKNIFFEDLRSRQISH